MPRSGIMNLPAICTIDFGDGMIMTGEVTGISISYQGEDFATAEVVVRGIEVRDENKPKSMPASIEKAFKKATGVRMIRFLRRGES